MDTLANMLSYYPDEKYLRKNWSPETLHEQTFRSLANAQKKAVETGVLSPSLANMLLPNAMVEGWNGYGLLDGSFGYPPNKRRDAMMDKMGLITMNASTPKLLKNWAHIIREDDNYQTNVNSSRDTDAKMAAMVLAEKARLYGEDKAVERWNGKGSAMEEYYGDYVKADAKNHVRKVEEANRMLQHPANRKLLEAYQLMLSGK